MTNQEALRVLHCPDAYVTDEDSEFAHTISMFSKAYGEALAVAFKALEQAPCEDAISRQAAIDAVAEAYNNDELFEGYEYRLEALPSVQPDHIADSDKKGDLISRQAAIEAMGEQPLNWTDTPEEVAEEQMWQAHIKALEELPSVTPARVRGEWMKARPFEFQLHNYECSKCLCGVDIKSPYCPGCGRKMNGIVSDMRGDEE